MDNGQLFQMVLWRKQQELFKHGISQQYVCHMTNSHINILHVCLLMHRGQLIAQQPSLKIDPCQLAKNKPTIIHCQFVKFQLILTYY